MTGIITFFFLVVLICGGTLFVIMAGRKKRASADDTQTAESKVVSITRLVQPQVNVALLDCLRKAEIGSLWVIASVDERGRHRYELLVRGDLDERQLDTLSRRDVVSFDKTFYLHRSALLNFMNRHDGPLARLADGEDIGWSGDELIHKCHQWGIIGGGVKIAFRNIVASRPRQAGSTATETAMTHIDMVLAEGVTPTPLVRRDSQIYSLSN